MGFMVMAEKVSFQNGEQLTARHAFVLFKYAVVIISTLLTLGISTITYIYVTDKSETRELIKDNNENKVDNKVLLQYMELHKVLHEKMMQDTKRNEQDIKEIEHKIEKLNDKYISIFQHGNEKKKINYMDLFMWLIDQNVRSNDYLCIYN